MLPESLLVPDPHAAPYRAASRLTCPGSRHSRAWVFDPSALAFPGTTAGQPPVRG
ncbi:hypothetical protein [Streptomyces sp. MI02-7b]|uniref:hypothetical protein n=1 Tax=Streptomyces sp. MI02-7b TaxID=462941 RepID=UPI0029AFE36C|nr:hypothetical protein [Streptomyces sp. MI02-7b]MDX3075992.1 hypothetical protein [Streptomyces sp. MI02-7b]